MSDDTFGPGLDASDFLGGLARTLGVDQSAGFTDMQKQWRERVYTDRAFANRINRVFSTKDGAAVLEWLIDLTLRRDEVPVDLLLTHTPQQIHAFSLVRAGENSAVKLILLAMAQAKNKRPRRRTAT